MHFDMDCGSENIVQPEDVKVFKVIGEPLVSSKPLTVLLDKSYEFVRCKSCLLELQSNSTVPAVGKYCSEVCELNDREQCAIEQIVDLSLDVFLPHYEHYNQFMTEEDFISFNKLFYRVLYSSKRPTCDANCVQSYDETFLPRNVTFNEIPYSMKIDEFEAQPIPIDELQDYKECYDLFTESERCEMDKRLKVIIPNDDYFRELYIQHQVKITMAPLLETVQHMFPSDERSYSTSLSFDEDYETSCSQANEIFHIDFSQNMFNVFSQSADNSQAEKMQNSLKIYRKQNPDFQTAEVQVDVLDEEKSIALYKQAYRNVVLDFFIFYAQDADTNRPKDDKIYGDWVRTLRKFLLNNECLKNIFGQCSWIEILRAFYVTIHYSIGIQDFVCSNTIALGVYLSLINVQHSCKPNCTFAFQDNQLQIFNLPTKKIMIEQNSRCNRFNYDSSREIIQDSKIDPTFSDYLPLEDRSSKFQIKVDFQAHLLFHTEKHYIDKLRDFRRLHCSCKKCLEDDSDQNCDNEIDHLSDNDCFMDLDSNFNDCILDQRTFDETDDSQVQVHDECFKYLKFIAEAGNHNHSKFCSKIQVLLTDVISNSRELFGYYHPRTTGFMFYQLCSRFQLLLDERDSFVIFYMYIFIDRLLDDVYQNVLITHGKKHPAIPILVKIHKICHKNLAEFYMEVREQLSTFEPSAAEQLTIKTMSFENCKVLSKIHFSNFSSDCEQILLYTNKGSIVLHGNNDDTFNYDPDSSLQSTHAQGRKRKISETEQSDDECKPANEKNNMSAIFSLLDRVFNISNHHYL